MNEIERLQQSIAILESQLAILDNAVVDTMLAPALEELASLKAQVAPVEQHRKQVTVLFTDVSGFTVMSETLEAEEVTEIMNALWTQLDAAITSQGGQIDKHIGDAVMALWGCEGLISLQKDMCLCKLLTPSFLFHLYAPGWLSDRG